MTLPVHFFEGLRGFSAGDGLEVTGDEAHHAVAVRRLGVGERVVLTDGQGTSAVAEVCATGKRLLQVRLLDLHTIAEPRPVLSVVQAIPKSERGELAVELLTEIGVAQIVPWAAARSVAVWRGERAVKSHAKWQSAAREAAKQSRRVWWPEVTTMASTAQVEALVARASVALILHESSTTTWADIAESVRGANDIVLIVGPEGGLSDAEVETFEAAGARRVRLGTEVLRTSSAGLAAAAAILAGTDRWA